MDHLGERLPLPLKVWPNGNCDLNILRSPIRFGRTEHAVTATIIYIYTFCVHLSRHVLHNVLRWKRLRACVRVLQIFTILDDNGPRSATGNGAEKKRRKYLFKEHVNNLLDFLEIPSAAAAALYMEIGI